MKQSYKVEEYASGILLLFTPHQPVYIHSIFDNGLNLKVNDRLVFIGTTKNGQLPFGIHLNQSDFDEIRAQLNPKDTIYWLPNEQSFYCCDGKVNICYSQAKKYTSRLERLNNNNVLEKIEPLLISLLNYEGFTGLDIDIEEFVLWFLSNDEDTTHDSDIFNYLNQLTESLFQDDLDTTKNTLRHILGRGKGLTPSGDDHIVGLLTLQAAFEPFSITFNQAVTELVYKESITTDVAREYLLYAAHDNFSSSVINLMKRLAQDDQPFQPELTQLLEMGHSSGVDSVFGILLGLLAMRRNSQCQKK